MDSSYSRCSTKWESSLQLTRGMKSCTLLSLEEKEEQRHSPGGKKELEEITWIIESIPCPQPGNILLDQRTLLFPTLQNPQRILQHLIIIPRSLLQKELWKIFLASSHNRNFVLSIKMQRSFPSQICGRILSWTDHDAESNSGYKNKREQTGMREMSSAPAVPDQCQGTKGKGEEKKLFFYPPYDGGEWAIKMLLPLFFFFTFWRSKTPPYALLRAFPTVPRSISPCCFSVLCSSQ